MSINFGCFSIDLVDLTTRLCSCIAPHISYVCKLKENLDALRTAKTGLTALKMEVKRKVDIAEVEMELEGLHTVTDWLSSVEAMEDDVEVLITDGYKEIENGCLGCCPSNCLSRYKLGKQVANKIIEASSQVGKGQFTKVADKQILASGSSVEKPSSEPVGLESDFKKVQSYIENEQVGIIGIYGIGGVGKTTLLTEINNKLHTNFNLVIWVVVSGNSKTVTVQDGIVVSRNSTTVKVQDGIKEKMRFHDDTWKDRRPEEKAERIFRVLNKRSFLLLLDDVWEPIDLKQVGVPIPNKHNNKSKIIFTTRSVNVCGRMEAQKKIKVKCLEWKQAWDLFVDKVGQATLNSDPRIPELAKTVVRECGGLPLPLITTGLAMACKTTYEEWKYGAQVLKENAAKFSDMEDKVLRILKLSYDNLQCDTDRYCFLYCSLFPEDYLISKEKLIEYWIGEGFLDELNNLDKGYDIIGALIHACLLEENSDGSVKMHDVIRDMALWIASEQGEVKG